MAGGAIGVEWKGATDSTSAALNHSLGVFEANGVSPSRSPYKFRSRDHKLLFASLGQHSVTLGEPVNTASFWSVSMVPDAYRILLLSPIEAPDCAGNANYS